MDGYTFLAQILSGRRRWYPPNTLGHPSGLWALDSDVEAFRAFRAEQRALARARAEAVAATLAAQVPHPTPEPPQPAHGDSVPRTPPMSVDPPTVPLAAQQPPLKHESRAYGHMTPASTFVKSAPRRPRRWWQFWRS